MQEQRGGHADLQPGISSRDIGSRPAVFADGDWENRLGIQSQRFACPDAQSPQVAHRKLTICDPEAF